MRVSLKHLTGLWVRGLRFEEVGKCQQQFQKLCANDSAANGIMAKDSDRVSQTAIDLLGWAGSHAAMSPLVVLVGMV